MAIFARLYQVAHIYRFGSPTNPVKKSIRFQIFSRHLVRKNLETKWSTVFVRERS